MSTILVSADIKIVLDLQSLPFSHPHLDLFSRLISSVFCRYSLCPLISIHHLHPSCLVSALLSTGYGPNGPHRNAIDDFSRQPLLLLQPPSSWNQLELYLILLPSNFEAFILCLCPTSTLAHRFPSALSNLLVSTISQISRSQEPNSL